MIERDPLADAVLVRDDFRCQYCGVDLLSDVRLFIGMVRDHLLPRHRNGPGVVENLVTACAACDRLKAGRGDGRLEDARRIVEKRWQLARKEFERVRGAVRGVAG